MPTRVLHAPGEDICSSRLCSRVESKGLVLGPLSGSCHCPAVPQRTVHAPAWEDASQSFSNLETAPGKPCDLDPWGHSFDIWGILKARKRRLLHCPLLPGGRKWQNTVDQIRGLSISTQSVYFVRLQQTEELRVCLKESSR